MERFKDKCKLRRFELLVPGEGPGDAQPGGIGARLASVFSLPQPLWPVLPPGCFYLLSESDPRRGGAGASYKFLQHADYPQAQVRARVAKEGGTGVAPHGRSEQ